MVEWWRGGVVEWRSEEVEAWTQEKEQRARIALARCQVDLSWLMAEMTVSMSAGETS